MYHSIIFIQEDAFEIDVCQNSGHFVQGGVGHTFMFMGMEADVWDVDINYDWKRTTTYRAELFPVCLYNVLAKTSDPSF